MRSAKRYTNATFTKRVDHDGGRHRAPRAPTEPAVCPGCDAVYIGRRWTESVSPGVLARRAEPLTVRICPACRQRRVGVPRGFVHIDGEFFRTHRGDVERLLHNEASRARENNPLQQILGWQQFRNGALVVNTSTEHLAQRFGRALEKAYDGVVRYRFSHETKVAHVWWRR